MSSTRYAEEGAPFRQERFASSAQFERGLMANLVAKRCEILGGAADRDLIWFLQLLSHAPGGLAKVAEDVLSMFPERLGTKSMHKFGFKPGQIYNAEQVRAVRVEAGCEHGFPLKGEGAFAREPDPFDDPAFHDCWKASKRDAEKQPSHYPASAFVEKCQHLALHLDKILSEFCLNPQIEPATFQPAWFPDLVDSLREFQARWIKARRAGQVTTELGRQVRETLEYCLEGHCLVIIDGLARTGKTFAAEGWCAEHPGRVRYVQTPSGTDDIGFYRAIAKSLGVSINLNSKAQQLRDRIEDVLQTGQLAVVFDEAHYLWPQSTYRQALPGRINWIMTALLKFKVPVALITTPLFMRSQIELERKTTWTGEQFTGRLGHYEKLPDSLSEADLSAVAKSLLPEGDAKSIKALVYYAQASAKYLAGIETAVRRARFQATKAGRKDVLFADVKTAIQAGAIPSDRALAVALDRNKSGRSRAIAAPLRTPRDTPDAPAPAAARIQNFATDRATQTDDLVPDPLAA